MLFYNSQNKADYQGIRLQNLIKKLEQ